MQNVSQLATLKVGVIVSRLPGERHADGITASVKYILDAEEMSLRAKNINVQLIEMDDGGDSGRAIEIFEECFHLGCICVIGPSSSKSMQAILGRSDFKSVPKIATFSTATRLSTSKRDDFFRVTMSDRERVVRLVESSQHDTHTPKPVVILSLADLPGSYSDGLRDDAIEMLKKRNIPYREQIFERDGEISNIPRRDEAVLFCSPSRQAVGLMAYLRNKGCQSQFFAFGSNKNFLNRAAVGAILVSDTYQDTEDPLIRFHISSFCQKFPQ